MIDYQYAYLLIPYLCVLIFHLFVCLQMSGSLGRAKLAPISLGSKPLPGIHDVSSPTLGPLKMSHNGTVSNLSGSLPSTAGRRLKDSLATSLKNGEKSVKNVDLGTVRISTTFEDEDDESTSQSVSVWIDPFNYYLLFIPDCNCFMHLKNRI